ncbi:MAG: hypothetical protein ACT4P2_03030 [Pseudomonadota bacterium]
MTGLLALLAGLPPAPVGPTVAASVMLVELPAQLRNLAAGWLLTGTIIGRDGKGQVRLRTDAGSVAFKTALPMPVGSVVTLQVQSVGAQLQAVVLSITPLAANVPPAEPARAPPDGSGPKHRIGAPPATLNEMAPNVRRTALAAEWPALKATIAVLADASPAIPRPGPRLDLQILSFLALATRAEMRTLLGDKTAQLLERAGKADLITRLAGELKEIATPLVLTRGEWHVLCVPILDGGELRQLRIFRRKKKPAHRRECVERFVVELEVASFGALQLDGLFNRPRLDLIVRSHGELPSDMRADLAALFAGSCAAADLNGQLSFATSAAFPVAPLEDESGPGFLV